MKAIVCAKYGPPDVLQIKEVKKPIPNENEVLIKIHATTVTAGDSEIRRLAFPIWMLFPIRLYMGILRPRNRILGQELAGEVEAVGKDVKRFAPGDQVFGTTGIGFGAYAEYVCLPEKSTTGVLAIRPGNVTREEAASLPTGALEALHFLKQANIQSGQQVLVIGAGGSIGTFAVQLAKHFGAEVTGIDHSDKLDMLRTIGADHVIDYTQEDFTTSGRTYDVIFDVMGKSSFSRTIGCLSKTGIYLLGNAQPFDVVHGWWLARRSSKRVVTGSARHETAALDFLKELMAIGKIKSVVDRCYSLAEIPEAHSYVDSGRKKGNVVITVA